MPGPTYQLAGMCVVLATVKDNSKSSDCEQNTFQMKTYVTSKLSTRQKSYTYFFEINMNLA